ncbi:MAG TPA: DUF1330 domain-containing protein [Chthoniobacterales bacterium]|jgi:hypothetical protein|nr:DUF1330 domain-containing protein [Chthoniobacterales bacterium]
MEGPDKFHRFVVFEFPTFGQGVACFTSPEYNRAAAFRRNGAGEVTTYQVEWLFRQCQELSFKKLQILRQALFEWVDEHPDYRFSVSTFGSVMRIALENYMNRHQAEFMSAGRA